jgi:hypothetical protein
MLPYRQQNLREIAGSLFTMGIVLLRWLRPFSLNSSVAQNFASLKKGNELRNCDLGDALPALDS